MSRENNRVYIGDLGSGGSKPELERAFEKYGVLKSVWVARNPPGFAFIEFEDSRDACDAVKGMDGESVCGVHVRVELAKNNNRRKQPRNDRDDYHGDYRNDNYRGGGGGGDYRGGRSSPRRNFRNQDRRSRSPDFRRKAGGSRSPSPRYRERSRERR